MTDQSLLGAGAEPAHLEGYGPVPAEKARELVQRPSGETPMWLRRLYTDPDSFELVATESSRRFFGAGQRKHIRIRDQWCRTPWCEAPIRHIDHIRPAEQGGSTSIRNGQGYCEACNHAKQAPGWTALTTMTAAHEVVITTPTGHRYSGRPPNLPGRRSCSSLERRLAARLRAA